MELRDVLKQAELFRGMGDGALAMLMARGRQKGFGQGGTLFVEGTRGTVFFLLLEGEVRLYKTSPEGQEVALRIIRPGEVFAEVVLFENPVYPVSAVALSPVRVFAMDRSAFDELLDEKDFRNEFIAMLMKKQRYLAGRILYLTSLDVEERFFRFIIEHYGTGGTYSVDMAKKDMASAIGTIPETFSRLINRLKGLGIISWEGGTLTVKRDYLENFMEEAVTGIGPGNG
ncbi:MAG TPA: Crp/Fnr family transcriptional regulator [Deltaproteobacteria bacterium]|nr:Crp/Fnr family transcriptional regulator [Deltaproteobacteria bacterium]